MFWGSLSVRYRKLRLERTSRNTASIPPLKFTQGLIGLAAETPSKTAMSAFMSSVVAGLRNARVARFSIILRAQSGASAPAAAGRQRKILFGDTTGSSAILSAAVLYNSGRAGERASAIF